MNWCKYRSMQRRFNPLGWDDIFKCILLNKNVWISPKISLKFGHEVRINNTPALVQIMACRRPGDKPLSEPMMVNLLTHICVTRPQWVNNTPALVQIMACRRPGKKPFSEPMMVDLLTYLCVIRPRWVLTKLSLTLGQGWIIKSHIFIWMWLLTRALNWMQVR